MEAGALLTGLLALLLISILGRTARIERLVQERTAELEAVSEKLRHLTVIDPLTQLLNRRGIEEKLARLTRRPETDVVAVLIDLDDFKCVNDSYGHSMGDAVLSGTAEAIVQSVRPTDLVARIGGDEFLAILPNSPLSAAASVAERIRTAVEKLSFEGIPRGEAPTVSLGAGAVPPATENVTELLKELGASLHKSKRAGKNRLSFV
jgi:diguanylate cyclase (GGDEF)-like protein